VSVAITVLVWLPPVIQQLTSQDGNLTALARFFTRPGSPHTFGEGITNTALQATLMVRGVFEPISLRADAHQGLVLAVVLSAAAFAVAVGKATIEFARTRASDAPRWRTLTRGAAVVVLAALCVSTIRAFPGDAGRINEDLDVPNNRALFG